MGESPTSAFPLKKNVRSDEVKRHEKTRRAEGDGREGSEPRNVMSFTSRGRCLMSPLPYTLIKAPRIVAIVAAGIPVLGRGGDGPKRWFKGTKQSWLAVRRALFTKCLMCLMWCDFSSCLHTQSMLTRKTKASCCIASPRNHEGPVCLRQ